MDQDERDFILSSAARLKEWKNTPREFEDPYRDMTSEEKSKLLIYQQQMLEEERKQKAAQLAKIEEMADSLKKMTASMSESNARLVSMMDMLSPLRDENARLRKELAEANKKNAAQTEQLKLGRKHRFGSKSQKGTKAKDDEPKSHEEDKDDYDGTNPPKSSGSDSQTQEDTPGKKERTDRQKMADMMRYGTTYRKMKAINKVTHRSSLDRLPQGARLIKMESRFAYEQQTIIIEHEYQLVTYRLNGVLYTAYLPTEGVPEIIDRVGGTKASADFLAHLSFNPSFSIRRFTEKCSVCAT